MAAEISMARATSAGGADQVDVAIVGAGTAGLAALREVRERTEDLVLINSGPYGTTCARVGCMTSKALIVAAIALPDGAQLDQCGVRGGDGQRAAIVWGVH